MLQCYVDESKDEGLYLVMEGLVSDAESWAAFSDEWQECLDMRPRMDYLHMREIMFLSYGDETKDRLRRFKKIIDKHVKAYIGVAIYLPDYEDIFSNYGAIRNPYLFAFIEIIKLYKENHILLGLEKEIGFVFDEQLDAVSAVVAGWQGLKEPRFARLNEHIGAMPLFKNDKLVLPLQAADFCAWWVRRDLNDLTALRNPIAQPWPDSEVFRTLMAIYSRKTLRRSKKYLDYMLADAAISLSYSAELSGL